VLKRAAPTIQPYPVMLPVRCRANVPRGSVWRGRKVAERRAAGSLSRAGATPGVTQERQRRGRAREVGKSADRWA